MNIDGLVTVSYIAATILFILALGGLSHQETARRGNWYGIVGMLIALLATVLGVVTRNYGILLLALLIGGSIGLYLARRVQMTQMPELVAILHSLVGLGAVLVGFATFLDPDIHFVGVEKTIHDEPMWVRESMMGALFGIGKRNLVLNEACIAAVKPLCQRASAAIRCGETRMIRPRLFLVIRGSMVSTSTTTSPPA